MRPSTIGLWCLVVVMSVVEWVFADPAHEAQWMIWAIATSAMLSSVVLLAMCDSMGPQMERLVWRLRPIALTLAAGAIVGFVWAAISYPLRLA